MDPLHKYVLPAPWALWGVSWLAGLRGNKPAVRRETAMQRHAHVVPMVLAGALVAVPQLPFGVLDDRVLPRNLTGLAGGTGLALAGLLWCAWARVSLGRNWSGSVTIKADHQLVTTGPYAWLRHPIYAGLLLAFLGSALALGEWSGVLAFMICLFALWAKWRREDAWLAAAFGETYAQYRQRVPTLIPFPRTER
ncbi:MAG: isoprenylcysteine carboxylmethyltransferase family protein [Alphaproteobacteria bacterium]|nr:isoprenylcysteine carboxylmethyltransferase family protein [Alphaproteobacteria bacterium]